MNTPPKTRESRDPAAARETALWRKRASQMRVMLVRANLALVYAVILRPPQALASLPWEVRSLNGDLAACRTAEQPLLPPVETADVSGILPPEFDRRIVEHACANEWAIHLDDVMVRRTNWHYYYRNAAQKALHVAEWMGALLDWPAAVRDAEIERYRTTVCCQPSTDTSSSPEIQRKNDQQAPPVV